MDELLVDTSGHKKETQPGAGLSDTLLEFSSEDTWKGVAPLSRPLIPPTDEVSMAVSDLSALLFHLSNSAPSLSKGERPAFTDTDELSERSGR